MVSLRKGTNPMSITLRSTLPRFGARLAPAALAVLATLSLSVVGCAGEGAQDDDLVSADEEAVGTTESAITGTRAVGTTLRTTTALNLRTGAGTGNRILVTMPSGATVRVLRAQPVSGWYEISYAAHRGWASGAYLADAGGGGGGGGGGGARTFRIQGPAVRAHVQTFVNVACTAVGCPDVLGTYNGHSPSADRAVDVFQLKARGDSFAAWTVNNGRNHRVTYAIWWQRINSLDGRGWRGMADRGSRTANHYDHVHVSFNP